MISEDPFSGNAGLVRRPLHLQDSHTRVSWEIALRSAVPVAPSIVLELQWAFARAWVLPSDRFLREASTDIGIPTL